MGRERRSAGGLRSALAEHDHLPRGAPSELQKGQASARRRRNGTAN